jgi:hypothetical protein
VTEKPIGTVPFPQQTPHTAARMLRGHRMRPLMDGWLLLYEDLRRPCGDSLVGKLCIVKTADQRILTRLLQKGRQPGTWDLLTATGEQELDVELVWAEKVTLIVPYEPTAEEAAAMGVVA